MKIIIEIGIFHLYDRLILHYYGIHLYLLYKAEVINVKVVFVVCNLQTDMPSHYMEFISLILIGNLN